MYTVPETTTPDKACIFCNPDPSKIILDWGDCYAMFDEYPVTELHTLIIPKQHKGYYFDFDLVEISKCDVLLRAMHNTILRQDKTVKGFNVGINCGVVAGQTVMHCHIHLIPRREFDVDNPTGGIRNIIPGKGCYR
jgi:diadenosine tetraphosphate (Ap4A) HIT family hydrolase